MKVDLCYIHTFHDIGNPWEISPLDLDDNGGKCVRQLAYPAVIAEEDSSVKGDLSLAFPHDGQAEL